MKPRTSKIKQMVSEEQEEMYVPLLSSPSLPEGSRSLLNRTDLKP